MIKTLRLSTLLSMVVTCGFQSSYAAEPQSPELATLLKAEDKFKKSGYREAETLFRLAFQTDSTARFVPEVLTRGTVNFAETLMALGKYEEGHDLFEARLLNAGIPRKPLQNTWCGTGEIKKSAPFLLVRGEHGIGDTFFFMRYMKQLHNEGVPVIVRERKFLASILGRQPYISGVITSDQDEQKTPYGSDIYAMSLPRYVSNKGLQGLQTADDIPYSTGYIEPRGDLVEKWKAHFSDTQKLHVLIGAYRASKNVGGECRFLKRDCAIADLIKKLARPNTVLYYPCSGDYKPIKRSEYEKRKQEGKLEKFDELDVVDDADWDKIKFLDGDFDKSSGAFEDTAAAMAAADYVVSVDTSTGMLAGALGANVKRFAVLLPKESDWRWGEGQPKTTPFFTNALLFWQKEQDNWSEPLAALSENVAQVADAKAHASE